MGLALGYGEAIVMGFYAANQQVVAVDDQVVGGESGGGIFAAVYIVHAILGGDMLHDDF